MKNLLILGIGNILMSDDGLGVRAIEYISSRYVLPRPVKLLDGGVAGLSLLPIITRFKSLIIADALMTRGKKPGSIKIIRWNGRLKQSPVRSSTHGIGVVELLGMAKLSGADLSTVIIGMVPQTIRPGLDLSAAVERKLPALARKIISEIESQGFAIKERGVYAREAHGRERNRGDKGGNK